LLHANPNDIPVMIFRSDAFSQLSDQRYNRTAFLPRRREMMNAWTDYLDGRRASSGRVIDKA
jgi:hypothetical protein